MRVRVLPPAPLLDAATLRELLSRIQPITLMGRAVQGERIIGVINKMLLESEDQCRPTKP